MKNIILFLLFAATVSAETARYDRGTELPSWILEEWTNAQDELLELEDLSEDPRRYGPEIWNWIEMDSEFVLVTLTGTVKYKGLTNPNNMTIIVCCSDRETVRHEAFHAILWAMKDPRYEMHYPELRSESKGNMFSRFGKKLLSEHRKYRSAQTLRCNNDGHVVGRPGAHCIPGQSIKASDIPYYGAPYYDSRRSRTCVNHNHREE